MHETDRLTDQHEDSDDRSQNGQDEVVPDPLAAALMRGERARQSILAAQGKVFDVDEVAARLAVGREDVLQRQNRGLLLALPRNDGTSGFPSWQFTESGLLPGLETVLRDIGVRDPWMQAAFFLSGDVRLDGWTPLEVLQRGEVEAVRRAAAAHGEQLAS